jgi:hypothetical protein
MRAEAEFSEQTYQWGTAILFREEKHKVKE